MNIEQARLLTLKTAWMMDTVDPKEARIWISMIKTVVPNMALKVIDDAIQMHGGIGVSNDTPLQICGLVSARFDWPTGLTPFTAWSSDDTS